MTRKVKIGRKVIWAGGSSRSLGLAQYTTVFGPRDSPESFPGRYDLVGELEDGPGYETYTRVPRSVPSLPSPGSVGSIAPGIFTGTGSVSIGVGTRLIGFLIGFLNPRPDLTGGNRGTEDGLVQ